jgi:hypothetical protein
VPVYGPFHRKTKSDEHPRSLLGKALLRGQLWGRGEKNSNLLAAMAFYGHLPDAASGFEFYSLLEPRSRQGGQAYWYSPPFGPAQEENGWAKIEIRVSRASSDAL